MVNGYRRLEINGSIVRDSGSFHLALPSNNKGYADAQIDDYGGHRRKDYPWRPGTRLELGARFSHTNSALKGTAGFGFWNAPFGDPTVRWPSLPQATWFFFASEPSDLPLAPFQQPGRGWFISTIDAKTLQAAFLIPLAPFVILLNNFPRLGAIIWPVVQRRLKISFCLLETNLTQWHNYRLDWMYEGCIFSVDDETVFESNYGPAGPLGFVCWIDNQYLKLTPTGRLRWGTLNLDQSQWLEVKNIEISRL